jgi:hypothetical protein
MPPNHRDLGERGLVELVGQSGVRDIPEHESQPFASERLDEVTEPIALSQTARECPEPCAQRLHIRSRRGAKCCARVCRGLVAIDPLRGGFASSHPGIRDGPGRRTVRILCSIRSRSLKRYPGSRRLGSLACNDRGFVL